MGKRRTQGEDSLYQICRDADGCPPAVEATAKNGGTKRERPEHKCRGRWAYSVDLGIVGGRRTRKTVTAKTKAEVRVKADALTRKLAAGVSPTTRTVDDWLTYWVDRVAPADGVRGQTLAGYRSKIGTYLVPALGHHRLQDLRPEHVEALHDWMRTLRKTRNPGRGEPLSETTIRQAHMVLRSALASALERGMVVRNVASVVRAPKAEDSPHAHLVADEAKLALRAAADERELCRLVCALVLGLRQGEALGLRWRDYVEHGEGRALVVEEAIARVGGKLVRDDVKSRASHRLIPLPERVTPIFDAWRAIAPAGEEYIFPGRAGGPCDPKRDWSTWRGALARAKVPAIPLHGARGSAASLLADMGVPDWRIAEILGHAQVRTTRRHYIAGTVESHRQAIDGLVGELLP